MEYEHEHEQDWEHQQECEQKQECKHENENEHDHDHENENDPTARIGGAVRLAEIGGSRSLQSKHLLEPPGVPVTRGVCRAQKRPDDVEGELGPDHAG